MLRSAYVAAALAFVPLPVLAQGSNAAPPAPATAPARVLGQTGTMYDGNNADLRMPPEPNAWYENTWAGYVPAPPTAPASATGPGAAGAALGTTQTGGEH